MNDIKTSNPLALRMAMTENSGCGSTPMLKIMFRTTAEMSAAADQIRALAKLPDETTAKHQGWCASINPDPCNCGIATKGASAWCPHYDLPIVNQPGCPDCAYEKTTGQWDPRAAAVKQDPHCATCKCFSEEPTPRHLQPDYVLAQIMNNSTDPWAQGVARTYLMRSPEKASGNHSPACGAHDGKRCDCRVLMPPAEPTAKSK